MIRRPAALGALALLAAATTASAAPSPPLDHDGRWLTDARGRVVILHGLNMVSKVGSYAPADAGFGPNDARFLRRNGFNTVRLGIIYKALEPNRPAAGQPGYDLGYLRSIQRTERALAKRGVFTLLDFHQDLYNERFQGEGWPDWQVLDDGVPSQPQAGFPANYLVNAGLNRAFDNFWANRQVSGIGLQDLYAAAWRRVALKFRNDPYVAGYDLLNEPWPGTAFATDACVNPIGCLSFDSTTLTPFSERVIAAIREADPTTLAFYEPLVTFDFGVDSHHGDTGDEHAGFSFHDYCLPGAFGAGLGGEACPALEEQVFDNADLQSEETRDVPFLTEFGATTEVEVLDRLLRRADEHMVSWQEWHYCACDDPTTSGPGAAQALVLDPHRPARGDNVDEAKLLVLARPYPRAVAGTPQRYGFDPNTREFTLAYSAAGPDGRTPPRSLDTEVFVPRVQYTGGYSAEVDGGRVVSEPDARVLRIERRRGADEVTVRVTAG
jgi:endoglycosylceramidase